MEYEEFSGKNLEAALQEAADHFGVPQEELEYEVTEEGSSGFLGFGGKPTAIRARKKFSLTDEAENFLSEVLGAMNMDITLQTTYDEEEKTICIDLVGDDMGILIGKRGQTLDSLQYLTSLVVNKSTDDYVRVKLDIENYRERRKETLETLARNIASKVRRTRRAVSLEPMNPYERRIIHSALQGDRYVTTKSEGEDPYRHVVILLKNPSEGAPERGGRYSGNRGGRGRNNYRGNRGDRSSSGRYGNMSRYDSEEESGKKDDRMDSRPGRRGYGSRYGSGRDYRGGSRYNNNRSHYGKDGDFYKNSMDFYRDDEKQNDDEHVNSALSQSNSRYGRYDEDSSDFGEKENRADIHSALGEESSNERTNRVPAQSDKTHSPEDGEGFDTRKKADSSAGKAAQDVDRKAIINKYNNVIEDDIAMSSYRKNGDGSPDKA